MHISNLKVKGYKVFKDEFNIPFTPGLNVLVGENGAGKSGVINALRLILLEDEYGRTGIDSSDFHRCIKESAKSLGAENIRISCEFSGLDSEEQVVYLPWLNLKDPTKAVINLNIENRQDNRGKYKRKIWGSESHSAFFDWELLSRISCIYLPPLRDAEEKLRAYKGSRLARLLKNLNRGLKEDEQHPLEKKFKTFNKALLDDDYIKSVNKAVRENIVKSVGGAFGQDASIQFAEVNFDRIVERLRLLFYPSLPRNGQVTPEDFFRELEENSLGHNNIIYLATILTELDGLDQSTHHKVLLIEEPEAHLHPQLQIRLLQFLEKKATDKNLQIIVTTHSPTIASAVKLSCIRVLTSQVGETPKVTSLIDCNIDPKAVNFLQRWLDITKSTLLFAKGVILVEGIAEAIVIKELAKRVLLELSKEDQEAYFLEDLEEYGITIINQNGVYFKYFMSLFQGFQIDDSGGIKSCSFIPIKCAGITDCDPDKTDNPTADNPCQCKNPVLSEYASQLKSNSKYCRLFSNLKTFEYDLALEDNNLSLLATIQSDLVKTNGPIKTRLNDIASQSWKSQCDTLKAAEAGWLLEQIDKGEFAQALAEKISDPSVEFAVPAYIVEAVKWVIS